MLGILNVFVLCLWSDHSKFMSLIYGFNFWRASDFILLCLVVFLISSVPLVLLLPVDLIYSQAHI